MLERRGNGRLFVLLFYAWCLALRHLCGAVSYCRCGDAFGARFCTDQADTGHDTIAARVGCPLA